MNNGILILDPNNTLREKPKLAEQLGEFFGAEMTVINWRQRTTLKKGTLASVRSTPKYLPFGFALIDLDRALKTANLKLEADHDKN